MEKTNEKNVNVNNSNVSQINENVVTENIPKTVVSDSETLPLADSSTLVEEIEKGDSTLAKKGECMKIIRNHYRAAVPSALELLGRFFRESGSSKNENVVNALAELREKNINMFDNVSILSYVFSLPAPIASSITRAASSWWGEFGDYEETEIDSVIDFANKETSLSNDVYFCEIKKEWLYINGNLVIYSASDSDGCRNMLLPGCYYKVVPACTENYIRSIGSVGAFLKAKRREINGKISNVFALEPAVKEYLKKILLAGFLDAEKIALIAASVEKEIIEEKENEELCLKNKISQYQFEVNELSRQIENTKELMTNANSAKYRRLNNKLKNFEKSLSSKKTRLATVKIEFQNLKE